MTILIEPWRRDALNGLALLVGYFLFRIQKRNCKLYVDREPAL